MGRWHYPRDGATTVSSSHSSHSLHTVNSSYDIDSFAQTSQLRPQPEPATAASEHGSTWSYSNPTRAVLSNIDSSLRIQNWLRFLPDVSTRPQGTTISPYDTDSIAQSQSRPATSESEHSSTWSYYPNRALSNIDSHSASKTGYDSSPTSPPSLKQP